MSYVAKHYTEIAGRKYTPGEVISQPVPAEKVEWLLGAGAIEPLMKMVPASAPGEENDVDGAEDVAHKQAQDNHAVQKASLDYGPDGDQLNAETEGDANEDPSIEDEEDAEPPVVDVMDGIVAPDPAKEAAAKPKTSNRRKKA